MPCGCSRARGICSGACLETGPETKSRGRSQHHGERASGRRTCESDCLRERSVCRSRTRCADASRGWLYGRRRAALDARCARGRSTTARRRRRLRWRRRARGRRENARAPGIRVDRRSVHGSSRRRVPSSGRSIGSRGERIFRTPRRRRRRRPKSFCAFANRHVVTTARRSSSDRRRMETEE